MTAPWANTVVACFLGALSGAFFFEPAWAGPTAARCLGPAIAGLLEGLLITHVRLAAANARVTKPTGPRSLPLRLGTLAALGGGAVALALLEQQVISFLPHFPFMLRATLVGAFVAGFTSTLGREAFAAPPAMGGVGNVEE
jgi:hypothetical protein